MTIAAQHAMVRDVARLLLMAKVGASYGLRLAVLLLLPLVAIYYLACTSSLAEHQRSQPSRVASKPYADAGTGRVKLLRPARIHVRQPRAHDLGSKGWDDKPKIAALAVVGFTARGPLPALEHTLIAADTRPDMFLFRTRNPRDPPRDLALP